MFGLTRLVFLVAISDLFGGCEANLSRETQLKSGGRLDVKEEADQGVSVSPGREDLPANLPALLRPLRDVVEDLKNMGARKPAPTDQQMRGHVTLARKQAVSMLEGAEATVSFLPKANKISSRQQSSTVALFVSLALIVGALCLAAPGQKGCDSGPVMQFLRLPFYACTWMALSAGLTIFNKWMFVPSGGDFPHVATLTWCHMLASTTLTRVLQLVQPGLFPAVARADMSRLELMRLVLPVALLQPITLVLGNTAYLYLSVSYIQMIKAAMPGMVFIISAVVGLESFSFQETLLLVMLGLGVAGCSHGELDFSWIGLAYQLSSFFCEALRIICLKLLVSQGSSGSLDPLSALFYVAPFNLVALTVPMLRELQSMEYAQIYDLRFVLGANCLTAFGLNIAGVCLMSLASAVTFTICGLLKDFGLIIGSTIIFGNSLTNEEIVGAVVVIGAAALFQRHQKQKTLMKK